MSNNPAILFANDAFYLAVANRDNAAMAEVWAIDTEVSCLHPGWPPIIGRDDVLESWRHILGNEQQPPIEVFGASARIVGGCAVVLCYETVSQNFLIATNLFVRENGLWRMILHQSGVTSPPEEFPETETSETVQ